MNHLQPNEGSSFDIIPAPPPPEPRIVLTLNLSLDAFKLLDERMAGEGQFDGAWYAVRDAKDELRRRGLL